jgi:hypothetical protein
LGPVADGLVDGPIPGLQGTKIVQKKTKKLHFQSQWIQVGQ